ncbi:MAG: lipoyl synthase [Candidatus Eremiobacteraeota bacterium]|nr:lipoyl synthase [Candidatus Eremiobacteraeota bacterium]MBV8374821.1 lipoyl synthase [Candidatus Eremiobacteraeota bacterium]
MAIQVSLIDTKVPLHVRKPDWLRVALPAGEEYERVKAAVNALGLNTVCKEAACPNLAECWGAGTATIMILGDTCTRGCRFCNVKTGNPRGHVDWLEPLRVAKAVGDLGWKYLVLTAVDRDDLPDGGALIFANTVREIHERVPGARVEILSGDYRGDLRALDIVMDAKPDVFAHNVETVRRLHPVVRDKRAGYEQSLRVLEHAKSRAPQRYTKTSIMLGLGEREDEIEAVMDDARGAGVDIFTMGQYLQPSKKHLPVASFVTPETFVRLGALAKAKGFHQVVSSPLSRSSYHAEQAFPGS